MPTESVERVVEAIKPLKSTVKVDEPSVKERTSVVVAYEKAELKKVDRSMVVEAPSSMFKVRLPPERVGLRRFWSSVVPGIVEVATAVIRPSSSRVTLKAVVLAPYTPALTPVLGRSTDPVTTKLVVVALVEMRLVVLAVVAVMTSATVVPKSVRLVKAFKIADRTPPPSVLLRVLVVLENERSVLNSSVVEATRDERSTVEVPPWSAMVRI